MLKIEVSQTEGEQTRRVQINTAGSLRETVAELFLAVRRMHMTVESQDPEAALIFQTMVIDTFCDPDMWDYDPGGEPLEQIVAIIPTPKKK